MNLRIIASALLLTLAWSSHADQDLPFNVEAITAFDEPWAMAFLPDKRMLVTEKKGRLLIVDSEGNKRAVAGLPDEATVVRVDWAMSCCIQTLGLTG